MRISLLIFVIILCLKGYTQSLCDPFVIIGETNQGKVWQTRFDYCYDGGPLLLSYDDPSIRTKIIKKYRIKSILNTSIKKTDSDADTTYYQKYIDIFDSLGCYIYQGAIDTNYSGDHYINIYNRKGNIKRIKVVENLNINGKEPLKHYYIGYHRRKGIFSLFFPGNKQKFRYNKNGFIKKEMDYDYFKSKYKYDDNNNIIKIKSGDVFPWDVDSYEYNSKNQLIKCDDTKDINDLSLSNRNYGLLFYDSLDHLNEIRTIYYDSSNGGGYSVYFKFNKNNLIENCRTYKDSIEPFSYESEMQFIYNNKNQLIKTYNIEYQVDYTNNRARYIQTEEKIFKYDLYGLIACMEMTRKSPFWIRYERTNYFYEFYK